MASKRSFRKKTLIFSQFNAISVIKQIKEVEMSSYTGFGGWIR